MSTRSGPEEHAASLGTAARALAGVIRRFTIGVTSSPIWQAIGHVLPDKSIETHPAETFPGVGFYARPADGVTAEAIALVPGGSAGSRAPVIVATRDEATRKAIANLAAGETAIFTPKAIVKINADGSIEIRSANGSPGPFATLEDLQVLHGAIGSAVITAGAGGAATINAAADTAMNLLHPGATWPRGTQIVKGE